DLPNKEEVILYPTKRMRLLFDSSNITIDTISDIPMERMLTEMNKMWDLALSYKEEGQIEKAAVLFLRYVAVNVDILPKHSVYPYMELDKRLAVNKRASEGMEHTTKIREILGRLYEEESMRLFNDIVEKSKFGQIALQKYSDGKTSFGEIVKDIRNMEKEELERNGLRLAMMPQNQRVDKTLALPSDLIEKYKTAVGTNDLVGVLLGTNPRSHYFVVSHVLLPGKQHTAGNAEKFFHKIRESTAPALGLLPLGLIHSCGDYFVCPRLKCRPPPPGTVPSTSVYPPPPLDHHSAYSACHHLFAQHLYQSLNPISITIIAHPKAENQCVWMTPAGQITAARRSLYNGEVTAKADHAKMSDAIKTTVIDLRGTEVEVKMDEAELVSMEEAKENTENDETENSRAELL
ncbi:hypothetical protein PMAYCL1PPCAC_17825, partial [Pristionchus mayeri]